jgi:ABC-type microcin C transport system permease subunit YejB
MGAYILKRILLMIPTLLGIMLVTFAVIQFAPGGPVECAVQVRAHGSVADGVAELRDGRLAVELRAPLRGVAPGQTMVLYRPDPEGDEVIGSATITR